MGFSKYIFAVVFVVPLFALAENPPPAAAASATPAASASPAAKGGKKPKEEKKAGVKIPSEIKNLIAEDLVAGSGKPAAKGKMAKVNYTGWFFDPKSPGAKGFQLDTSEGKEPFTFPLGGKQVIAGWDEGVVGMKVGGKRRLYIPADLAYGNRGTRDGVVPANQALIFEVELLDVIDK